MAEAYTLIRFSCGKREEDLAQLVLYCWVWGSALAPTEMIVLGLHGWEGNHDAAAALVINGKLTTCVEEERLNRRKHAISDSPRLAVRALLAQAGIELEDVDVISYGWDFPVYARTHGNRRAFADDREFLAAALGISPRRWPRFEWIDHHLAHAAARFYASGFNQAAVLVVDGQGETKSITLFKADQAGFRFLRDWLPNCSLGFLYEAATLHCGFRFLDAGKTMGLAAYGSSPAHPLPIAWDGDDIVSPVPRGLEEDAVTEFWAGLLAERYGSAARPEPLPNPYAHSLARFSDEALSHSPAVAAAAQEAVERVLGSLVEYSRRAAECAEVVLAGGVALNCVANGIISPRCAGYFVPPYAHDAGAAVGAALISAARAGDAIHRNAAADLGLQYSNAEIERVIKLHGAVARRVDDPAEAAASLLLSGQVIGWFQGRGEVGPRALGRRSILALPTPCGNCARVNWIKGREQWRPLAPSALECETEWMFGRHWDSPYMLLSLPLTQEARHRIPAVSHVDGSTRVQTVPASGADKFARLLALVRDGTGFGVLLNTSFNSALEPIVCSPADSLPTFGAMGLDSLVLGNFIIEKQTPRG